MKPQSSTTGVAYALGAAALFGASTPFAKRLLPSVETMLLAGLLYLGSGLGLAVWRQLCRRKTSDLSEARLIPFTMRRPWGGEALGLDQL